MTHYRSGFHLFEQTWSNVWLRHRTGDPPALAVPRGFCVSPAPVTSPTQLAN